MSMKALTLLNAHIFAAVAAVHGWRLMTGASVHWNESTVPMWVSIVGLVVAFGLFVMNARAYIHFRNEAEKAK